MLVYGQASVGVQVRELPLTANGKTRKQELRELWQAMQ